jgi:lysyl-tRNA synthetase class 2
MLAAARRFFAEKDVLEVDCPALGLGASIDAHIDVMNVNLGNGKTGYLHTSPEYEMKRLLAAGSGDIYQLSHVFRAGEQGRLHHPEFTMVEWYRCGMTFSDFIKETLDFCRLFLGPLPATHICYREALQKYAGIDYLHATPADLAALTQHPEWDKDTSLEYITSFHVEPHLGKDQLCVLTDYPASQAALAQTKWKGEEHVAERFEIYYRSIELANGYHELTDAKEQRQRFEESNQERENLGKESLPLDEPFLQAMEHGLPECCGVAVGFDRLLMLRLGKTSLKEVLPLTNI